MVAPRISRELSWAAAKLREVAAVLSRMSVRLTVAVESDRMAATDNDRVEEEEHETPQQGVLALTLGLREVNHALQGQAEADSASGSGAWGIDAYTT